MYVGDVKTGVNMPYWCFGCMYVYIYTGCTWQHLAVALSG